MLHRLLHSEDRFQILRGLEILGSLATVESNEEILVNALGKDAFSRVTDLLTGDLAEAEYLMASLVLIFHLFRDHVILLFLLFSSLIGTKLLLWWSA